MPDSSRGLADQETRRERTDAPAPAGRALEGAVLATGAACAAANFWQHQDFFHDDAFISLRYADNLIRFGELVWNPGERVEGYTNFLHILLVAVLGWTGVALPTAAQFLNAGAAAALAVAFIGAARIAAPDRDSAVARAVGLALLIASPPLAIWTLGGLEAVPLAAFVLAAHLPLLRILQGQGRAASAGAFAGICFAAAFLMRPDALIFAAAAAGAMAVAAPHTGRERWTVAAAMVALPALTALAHASWRLHYYGAMAPNTFHAKVGVPLAMRLETGFAYLLEFAVQAPAWGLLIGSAAWMAWRSASRRSAGLLIAGIVAQAAYIVWIGGDHMEGSRLFVPIVPLAALLVVLAVASLPRARAMRVAPILGGALPVLAVVLRPALPTDPAAFVGSLTGRHIAQTWGDGAVVALNTSGSIPYFAPGFRYIDMLGLNDPVIARRRVEAPRLAMQRLPGHSKGDGAYILRRRPDYIVLGPAEGSVASAPWFLSDLELAEHAEFHLCYREVRESIPYGDEIARRGPPRPRPLLFTYYRRICGA